jgi:GT2 family glycosyltransferase
LDLSIIIVNWNSKDYLRKCLATIAAERSGIEYEIIVIDSASFDGSEEMVRWEFPRVKFIQSRENLGFSKSNNTAFAASQGEVLLFLNPDTEMVGPAINGLYWALKNLPDAGAVGGKLLNSDGTIQTSCVQPFPTILNQVMSADALRRRTPRANLWGMRAIYDFAGKPLKVEMISGACLMMRRSVFEKIGGFSTEYFMYAEDVDLCYKAQQSGFANYYFGSAEVIHHGGGSSQQARSNFSSVMMVESISQFLQKSRGFFYSLCYRVVLGFSALLRVVVLVVLSPILLIKSGVARWRSACSKWFAIFNWGMGCSRWTRQYRKSEPVVIGQSSVC